MGFIVTSIPSLNINSHLGFLFTDNLFSLVLHIQLKVDCQKLGRWYHSDISNFIADIQALSSVTTHSPKKNSLMMNIKILKGFS